MTRIAVFGGSGGTGREVVREARAGGHEVIVVTRNLANVPDADGITVREGDVTRADTLTGVLDGVDSVISALGPDGRTATTVYSKGIAAIVGEMIHSDVPRIVVVSAVPASADAEKTPFERYLLHPILWRFFGAGYRDLRTMESQLRGTSQVSSAIVRPPLLTDDASTKPVRASWDVPLGRPSRISRGALARVLIDVATAEPFRAGVLTVSE